MVKGGSLWLEEVETAVGVNVGIDKACCKGGGIGRPVGVDEITRVRLGNRGFADELLLEIVLLAVIGGGAGFSLGLLRIIIGEGGLF